MQFPVGQTVTIIRATYVVDDFGDLRPTGPPSRTVIAGCALAPRSSSDVTEPARQGVLVGLTLYIPDPAVDIVPTDRVEWGGVLYDIDGDVGVWRSPFAAGLVDGVEVALRRTIG